MKRHELDPISLVFGVIFLFVAASYLLSHAASVHLHWVYALPAALIAVGVGVLAVVARGIQREQHSAPGADVPGGETSLSE